MKRIPFYKLSGLVINLFLVTFVFTACKKQTSEVPVPGANEEITTAKAGSKPNTYPVVPLIMTVVNAGNKITSDNGDPYINGVDNVSVSFDQSGNFMYRAVSNSPKVPQPRFLKYDFSDPVGEYTAWPNIEQGKFISSGATTSSPAFIPLQNLPVTNPVPTTQCIGMSSGFTTLANGTLNFHRLPNDDTDGGLNPTSYVYVTRIDADHWEITPSPPLAGGCSSVSNVASLRISGILQGKYNMPFKFLLERKLP